MATATPRKKSPTFSQLRSRRAREPHPTACSLRAVYRPACPILTTGSTPSKVMRVLRREPSISSRRTRTALRAAIEDVDAIVLLHSTNGDTTDYLEPFASILADRRVPLLSFVGNEVNLPGSPISAKRRLFEQIRPDWIATQLLEEAGRFLFGDVVGKVGDRYPARAQSGCVSADALRSMSGRSILETRLSRYLPHLGDDDRNRLADTFARLGAQGRLKVDISDARLDRGGWSDFLNQCRGTIATESGSWFLERDDATVDAIRAYVREKSPRGFMIANDSSLAKIRPQAALAAAHDPATRAPLRTNSTRGVGQRAAVVR